jgi:hypothetical protein
MINDVALFSGPDYDSTKEFSGDGLGAVYSNWDKSSIQMCECDRGYFGPDCTLRKYISSFFNLFSIITDILCCCFLQ